MHRVPEDFNYGLFEGASLQTVTFGPDTVHFSFADESGDPIAISVEGTFLHSEPESAG